MNVVIINGWAMPESIWGAFCRLLKVNSAFDSCQVLSIDKNLSASEWVAYLDEHIEPDTFLIGWSLGGMLAVEYACQHSEKIKGLCTLQMNPKFVVAPDWLPAMTSNEFQAFRSLAEKDAKSMIKHFGFLVTAKGADALSDLKKLNRGFTVNTLPSVDVFLQSLELLEMLDVRSKLTSLSVPQLHIYGEQDQLVPQKVSGQVKSLNEQMRVELIPGLSHFPCYGAANLVTERIHAFAGDLH